MEKEGNKDIEQIVAKRMESWRVPFDEEQPERAKAKIMNLIGEESQQSANAEDIAPRTWMRIAAGFAVIVVISIAISIFGKTEVFNESDSLISFKLPDGSEVTLNPNSKLSYNSVLWMINRSLEFTGEGFFDVETGSKFLVQTPKGDITVLGTQFTVWADSDDLMVHCAEGKVEVSNELDKVLLSQNQFTHYQSKGLSPKKNMKHIGFLAPRKTSAELIYNETPLSAVLQELELVLDTEIKCTLDINSLNYSGALNPNEISTCFDVLCKPFGAKYKRNPDGFFVIYE